jgi:SAM-dependent methyltransferase
VSRQADYRARYAAAHPGWKDGSTLFRELLGSVVGASTRLLDVGCGRRGLGKALLARAGLVVGVDPDEPALRENHEIARRAVGVAEHLPFADRSFDVASLRFVVEHLPDPQRVFGELARVVAPGGRVAILTPNDRNPVTWIIRAVPNRYHGAIRKRMFGGGEDPYPTRYRANSAVTLDRMLGAAGFEREWITFNGDPSYLSFGPISSRASRALERLLDAKPLQRARVHLLAMYRKR